MIKIDQGVVSWEFRVWSDLIMGLDFRFECRGLGLRFGVLGSEFGVWGVGCGLETQGLGFRVWG